MPSRIHIFGASGTGTTSLASALAARHGHRHVDTDDFYWLRTDPPYRHPRPRAERLAMLRIALAESASWVLSGSLCGWGDRSSPSSSWSSSLSSRPRFAWLASGRESSSVTERKRSWLAG